MLFQNMSKEEIELRLQKGRERQGGKLEIDLDRTELTKLHELADERSSNPHDLVISQLQLYRKQLPNGGSAAGILAVIEQMRKGIDWTKALEPIKDKTSFAMNVGEDMMNSLYSLKSLTPEKREEQFVRRTIIDLLRPAENKEIRLPDKIEIAVPIDWIEKIAKIALEKRMEINDFLERYVGLGLTGEEVATQFAEQFLEPIMRRIAVEEAPCSNGPF